MPLGSALGPVHPASPWKVWATGQGTALVRSQTAWNGGVPVGLAPRVGGWENAVCSGVDSRGLCEVRNALGPQWDPSRRDPAAVAPSAVGVNVEGGGLRSLAWRGCQPPGMQGTPWHNPVQILIIPSGECRLCEPFPNTITALQCTVHCHPPCTHVCAHTEHGPSAPGWDLSWGLLATHWSPSAALCPGAANGTVPGEGPLFAVLFSPLGAPPL